MEMEKCLRNSIRRTGLQCAPAELTRAATVNRTGLMSSCEAD
jgi:hypothetical protein